MRKYLILSLAAVLATTACTRTYRAVGDTHLTVFDHAHVQFLPDSLGGFTDADAEGIVHLTNGRIILKKVQVPDYKRKVDVKLTVSVKLEEDAHSVESKKTSMIGIPQKSMPSGKAGAAAGASGSSANSSRRRTGRS